MIRTQFSLNFLIIHFFGGREFLRFLFAFFSEEEAKHIVDGIKKKLSAESSRRQLICENKAEIRRQVVFYVRLWIETDVCR